MAAMIYCHLIIILQCDSHYKIIIDSVSLQPFLGQVILHLFHTS